MDKRMNHYRHNLAVESFECAKCYTTMTGRVRDLKRTGWIDGGGCDLCPDCAYRTLYQHVQEQIVGTYGFPVHEGAHFIHEYAETIGILTKELGWTLQEINEMKWSHASNMAKLWKARQLSRYGNTHPSLLDRLHGTYQLFPWVYVGWGWSIRLEFKFPDLWWGLFFTKTEAWVCLLPCLPLHFKKVENG